MEATLGADRRFDHSGSHFILSERPQIVVRFSFAMSSPGAQLIGDDDQPTRPAEISAAPFGSPAMTACFEISRD